jgi:hypothetical protein
MDQTAKDLNLSNEIEEPLSANTSKLNLNYLCSLGCRTWVAEDKGQIFQNDSHIKSIFKTIVKRANTENTKLSSSINHDGFSKSKSQQRR